MSIFFLLFGLVFMALGLVNIFSTRFDKWIQAHVGESKADKAIFTSKQRYFIRRYLAGFQFFGIGTILIALYLAIHFHM